MYQSYWQVKTNKLSQPTRLMVYPLFKAVGGEPIP